MMPAASATCDPAASVGKQKMTVWRLTRNGLQNSSMAEGCVHCHRAIVPPATNSNAVNAAATIW